MSVASVNVALYLFFLSGGISIAAFLPAWIQAIAQVLPSYFAEHALSMSVFYGSTDQLGRDLTAAAASAVIAVLIRRARSGGASRREFQARGARVHAATNKGGIQVMTDANTLQRQGHRLLQIGVALILFVSLEGFAIPALASPRIGLSVHTLGTFQGILLLALGMLWTRLRVGPRAVLVAFWTLIYSTFAILAAYVIAATWGVGIETIMLMGELPHGLSRGTDLQENVIRVVSYSSAPTGLTAFALILWGLRGDGASSWNE